VRGLLLVALLSSVAYGDPQVVRLATIAPEGTAWAREMQAFARDVDAGTAGRVRIKWYYGAIAGDDLEAAQRIERGQLDGVASGPWQCERWAPSYRVLRLPGLFEQAAEATFAAHLIKRDLDEEFAKAGFINLGEGLIGPAILFLREPVKTFSELTTRRLWKVDKDEDGTQLLSAMGLSLLELPFDAATRAYDEKKHDGFITPPTGALAFQWYVSARYALELHTEFLMGCLALRDRSFHKLAFNDQQTLRAAAAKLAVRFGELGELENKKLLDGLLQRQGVKQLPVSDELRRHWRDAAKTARQKFIGTLVSRKLLDHVLAALADWRAEHAH
jgi:TRAP-type C4-dicarboxylate transport system substrate-binding protein